MSSLDFEIEMALQAIQNGEVEKGISQLYSLAEQGVDDPYVMFELANVFYELGHLETAKSLLEQSESYLEEFTTDDLIDWRILRAEILMDEGELDGAMEELLECLELEPDLTRASILMAEIYLMQDLPEIACRQLEGILIEEPDQLDIRYILSGIYIDLGELEKANEQLALLEGTEFEEKTKLSRAKLLSKAGKFEEALELYREVLQTEFNSEALLGSSLTSMQIGQPEQAIYFGTKLLEQEPEHIGAYQVISSALEKLGRYEQAKRLLEQALLFNEHEESILMRLVDVCYQMGDKNASGRFLDQWVDHHGETEEALKWKDRLL